MEELVVSVDSKSTAERRLGSSPSIPTKSTMGSALRSMRGCAKAGLCFRGFSPVLSYSILEMRFIMNAKYFMVCPVFDISVIRVTR